MGIHERAAELDKVFEGEIEKLLDQVAADGVSNTLRRLKRDYAALVVYGMLLMEPDKSDAAIAADAVQKANALLLACDSEPPPAKSSRRKIN